MNLTLLAENMIQSRGELELQKSELEEIVLQMIHQYSQSSHSLQIDFQRNPPISALVGFDLVNEESWLE